MRPIGRKVVGFELRPDGSVQKFSFPIGGNWSSPARRLAQGNPDPVKPARPADAVGDRVVTGPRLKAPPKLIAIRISRNPSASAAGKGADHLRLIEPLTKKEGADLAAKQADWNALKQKLNDERIAGHQSKAAAKPPERPQSREVLKKPVTDWGTRKIKAWR